MQVVTIEYFIQNDKGSNDSRLVKPTGPNHPNAYLLNKKYESISQVSIADVIKIFPLNTNVLDGGPEYSNLHFRFETSIYNPHSGKKIVCFRDVSCPDERTM